LTERSPGYTIKHPVNPREDLEMFSKVIRFFTSDIFSVRLKDLRPVQAFFIRYLRIFILAVQGFLKDDCAMRASALTYYTLLSIVPVVAMAFGIAKGFGLQELIQKQIIQVAEGANWPEDIVVKILSFSDSMLESAKGGIIAGVGFALLCWTVVNILGKVEDSFNHIWEVKKPRSLVRKFTDYIAIVVLAPILLIISSSAAVVVSSKIEVIVRSIELLGVVGPLIFFVLRLLPYVSIWVLLMLNYIIMPNTRVPVKSAVLAGIITGTIFQAVQFIYIKFQIGVAHYGAIYGSFAVLPLFVAWVQISWMIVLLGAEIAVAYENQETFGFRRDFSGLSIASKKLLVLRVFHLMVKRFAVGEPALSATQIARTLEIPVRLVRQILGNLAVAGLVAETTKTVNHEATYQPARTIEDITIQTVFKTYEQAGTLQVKAANGGENDRIAQYVNEISMAISELPANVRLKDI
jgi:membrane protein